jgi:DNA-binding CsgD family transcriptional regulator
MAEISASGSAVSAELFVRVLSCTSYEQMGECLLTPVSDALHATSSVFLQFCELPTDGHLVGRRVYVGHHPRSVEVYAEGVYNLDPVLKPGLQWLRSGADGQNASVSLLSGIPGWRDQAYYREFLLEYDIRHVLAVVFPVRSTLGSEMMCLGFHRAHEAQPFSTEEVGKLHELVPVMQSVITNLAFRDSIALSSTVLDSVADSCAGMGFVILDEDLLVRHANRRGLTQLGLYAGASCRSAQSASVFGEIRQRLMCLEPAAGPRGRFTVAMPREDCGISGQLDIEVRAFRDIDARIYYVLVTSERSDRKVLDDACACFALSEREIDVARLICAGQNNGEISRGLGIALRTVENHLRSVYAKVGVNSRTQLVSRLLGLN